MIYLTLEELLHVAERVVPGVKVRDLGLIEAAAARPRATAFGEDAYPGIHDKAAALLHSITCNHALIDGNKPLALAGAIAFYGMNGLRLTLSNDEAYDLVMAVASGELDDVAPIAANSAALDRTTRDARWLTMAAALTSLAEDHHQQYLARNENGYCGIGGTGVSCPVGTGTSSA